MGTGSLIIGKIVAGILFSLPVIWPALLFTVVLVAFASTRTSPVEMLSGCLQVSLIIACSYGVTIWLAYRFIKAIMSQH